jgi:hypothetical protein
MKNSLQKHHFHIANKQWLTNRLCEWCK